jgi:hypothetical protein
MAMLELGSFTVSGECKFDMFGNFCTWRSAEYS